MALGKGLASLIPHKEPQNHNTDDKEDSAQDNARKFPLKQDSPAQYLSDPDLSKKESVYFIETDKIIPNSDQPRKDFKESELQDLAESIREHGILQPLIVSRLEKSSPSGRFVEYELIAGERRLRAAKIIGLMQVPVIIKKAPEKNRLEISLVENIQRSNLSPIEEAEAFRRLQDEFGLTQKEIARRVGKSREVIANTLRLINLPLDIKKALGEKRITPAHAKVILSVASPEKQIAISQAVIRDNLSVEETEKMIQAGFLRPRRPFKRRNLDPELVRIEEKIRELLGTKVKLSSKGDGGRLIIDFYSKEELDSIINRIITPEALD